MDPVKVLFICTGNTCRSQMAEGLAQYIGGDRVIVYSAGSNPSGTVAARSYVVMEEVGIDIHGQRSEGLDIYIGQTFDWVITLCGHANEVCPNWPGMGERRYWPIPDPYCARGSEDDRLTAYRESRDMIYDYLLEWFTEIGVESKPLP
ncbi:MAG: arsenate reductase ArsC [bacterium]|nr:arsenate reductase ArsC [bacterium]